MIELIVLNYLKSVMDEPVVMTEPSNPSPDDPKTYVLVMKTGSGITNHIKEATMAIQSYAPTVYEAAVLNEKVKEAMEQIITLDDVTSCKLNSDYIYNRESTKQPRYQAVFDIRHY